MSYSTPTKHDGRAVLFAIAELLGFSLSLQNFSNSYCVSFSVLLDGV